MTKTTKIKVSGEAAEAKPKKHNINWRKLVRKYLARPVAFVALVIEASRGLRHDLESVQSIAAFVLTVFAVLAIVYILLCEE